MNSSNVIDQNRIRQIFFIIIIVLLGIELFLQLYGFLSALLGAITLYIIMHRWMFYLTLIRKWRKGWTAFLLMFLSMIIILLPIGMLVNMLSSKVSFAIQHSSELVNAINKIVDTLEQRFNIEIVSKENINKLGNIISTNIPRVLSATFNTLGTIFFMYFILYFMLVNGREMEKALYEHIPLKDENVNRWVKRFTAWLSVMQSEFLSLPCSRELWA